MHAELLEQIAGRCRVQVRSDDVRQRVRLDLVDEDGEVLARVYLSPVRAMVLVAAIGRAALRVS